ncbi:MAG TPA: hypothetical protein VIH75_01835 [Candidatus Sulfotelmatobacter sp.]|jgi:hypothetical protein
MAKRIRARGEFNNSLHSERVLARDGLTRAGNLDLQQSLLVTTRVGDSSDAVTPSVALA